MLSNDNAKLSLQTALDGDTLYAVTTNAVENRRLGEIALGVLAAETAWDAVLTSAENEP